MHHPPNIQTHYAFTPFLAILLLLLSGCSPAPETAEQGLEWLAEKTGTGDKAVLIYNHPSRKDDDPDENLSDMLAWQAINPLFIGFEGAPGHQKTRQTGSYVRRIKTRDRWDPVAADSRSGVPEILFSDQLSAPENSVNWTLSDLKPGADQHSAYFRVRIRKPGHDAADLMAYTNPIRLVLR